MFSFQNWLFQLGHVFGNRRQPRKQQARGRRFIPVFEPFEARRCPADFAVTGTNLTGPGSLQQAILDANAAPGADRIYFYIRDEPVSLGPPAGGFPAIVDTVTIDGGAPEDLPNQEITLWGNNGNGNCFEIKKDPDHMKDGSGSVIRNLTITSFSADGIFINGVNDCRIQNNWILYNLQDGVKILNGSGNSIGYYNVISGNLLYGVEIGADAESLGIASKDNKVFGNYIGTNADGTAAVGNQVAGIRIFGEDGGHSSNTVIGGGALERNALTNIISGNAGVHGYGILIENGANGTKVLGNYIGVNKTGTQALANAKDGIRIYSDTSSTIIRGNLISGNTKSGIHNEAQGDPTEIMGNYIGTDINGTIPVPNGLGIEIQESNDTIVGAATDEDRNIISGNTGYGMELSKARRTKITGNYIGTDSNGVSAVANAAGVYVGNDTDGTVITQCVISGNQGQGIVLDADSVFDKVTLSSSKIGVKWDGQTGLANGNTDAVAVFSGKEIIIDGNTIFGVTGIRVYDGAKVTITSNRIGLTSDRTARMVQAGVTPNVGIQVDGGKNVTIGGVGGGNYIGGQRIAGVYQSAGTIDMSKSNVFGKSITDVPIPNKRDEVQVGGRVNRIAMNFFGNSEEAAVTLIGGTGTLIDANTFLASQGTALDLVGCTAITAQGNTIGVADAGNAGKGVFIEGGSDSITLTNNQIWYSGQQGVDIDASGHVTLTGNDIYKNTLAAVLAEGGSNYVTLDNNAVYENLLDGVDVLSANYVSMSENSIHDNFGIGTLFAGGGGHTITDNTMVLNGIKDLKLTTGDVAAEGQLGNADTYLQTGGELKGSGLLTVNVWGDWTGGSMTGAGVTHVNTYLTIHGGGQTLSRLLESAGVGEWTGSSIGGDGTIHNLASGAFSGYGTFTGNFTNHGALYPGFDGTAGTIALGGNFTHAAGTLFMDLGATSDLISVEGTVSLAGALTVNVLPSFVGGPPYTLIDNAEDDPVDGIFAGRPELSVQWLVDYNLEAYKYHITYQGGPGDPGNDVALKNDPPIATPNDYVMPSARLGATLTGNVITDDTGHGSDSDVDGDNLIVVKVNGDPANVGVPITLASGATLTVNANGSFLYDPLDTFAGVDTFNYTIWDEFHAGMHEVTAGVTITVMGHPLRLDEGDSPSPLGPVPQGGEANSLDDAAMAPLIAEAARRWAATLPKTGTDSGSQGGQSPFSQIQVHVADLPDALLGMAGDQTIWIDRDAAGVGWFVDATPWEDSEFGLAIGGQELRAPAGSAAYGRIDLASVLAHEMGHLLGFEHGDEHEVMGEALGASMRRLPNPITSSQESGVGSQESGVRGQQAGDGSLAILDQLFAFDAAGLGKVNYLLPASATQQPLDPRVPVVLDPAATLSAPLAEADFQLARPNGLGSTEDVLVAGAGSDLIIGEPGQDFLIGGFGE